MNTEEKKEYLIKDHTNDGRSRSAEAQSVEDIIQILDGYTQSGGSRMKIQTSDELTQGQVKREYHHGRCDVNSPWALGTAFDVLEDEEK